MSVLAEKKGVRNLRKMAVTLFWPLVIAATYYLSKREEIYVDESYQFWALAHIYLHCIPIYLYLISKRHPTSFPFIETLAAFNIVHFGLPVYFIELEDFQLGILDIWGLSESFICYVVFYSVYYLFFYSNIVKVNGVEFTGKQTNLKVLKYYGYILLLCYFGSAFFTAIYHIGTVGLFIYIGLFMNLWREKLLKLGEKFIFTLFLVYEFLNRGLGGLLAPFALLILFIVLCIILSKSSKWLILIPCVLFIWFYSLFSNIKYEYRNAVWYEGKGNSFQQKIALLASLNQRQQLEENLSVVKEYKGKDHFLWRFSYQSSALSMVIQKTPQEVPFWNGDSYAPLFSKFIPRFIWPDKPTENMGYRFGTTYGVIRAWNTTTSINTPILPELYMNFGYTGLYIGCVVLGFLYFLLARWFNNASVSYVSKVIGMSIIFPLMIWESNFSLIFGNLILMTFVFFALYRVLDRYIK